MPSTRRSPADFKAAQRRDAAERLRRAILTAVCLAALLAAWSGETFFGLPTSIAIGLYLVSFVAGGYDSVRETWSSLRHGTVDIDLLMIVAAVGAAALGDWAEGGVLLFLFALSNTLEEYVLGRTRRAIAALMELAPEEAVTLRDGREVRVPVEELRIGDVVVVRPGERIPADGTIRSGRTSVDQSAMTGESVPVEKEPGDVAFAATLNQQGAIEIVVSRPASESTLARMVHLVEEAQAERAPSQRFTDWFGRRYTLVVLGLSAVTLAVPLLFLHEPFERAFYRAMTVLVVASPCAVVISIPAAILSAITSAARGGVLFKGGAALETAAALRAIAFDKTGTLTLGRPRLTDLATADGVAENDLLTWAAAVESRSEHPLARAIVEAARERQIEVPVAEDVEAVVARGIRARLGDRTFQAGKADLFAANPQALDETLRTEAERLRSEGKTVIFVGDETRVLGLVAVADTLRPSAAPALAELRTLGIARLEMLTGDNHVVAAHIAGKLGLEQRAELMPEDKLEAIRELRRTFGPTAMVGDGINDAPSLAIADLGVSLGKAGTDVALETADLVLMADDLRHIPYAIRLARQAQRVVRQNLIFAFGVMLTLLGFTYFATLPLPIAVAGHEGSTVLVILNGIRLLAFRRPQAVDSLRDRDSS